MTLRQLPWLFLLWSGPALSCSCAVSTLEDHLERSPNAFLGRLVSVVGTARIKRGSLGWFDFRAVRVRVLETWKGPPPGHEVIIATPSEGSACGFEFEDHAAQGDSSFVIFASPLKDKKQWPWDEDRSGWLMTNLCAGSFATGAGAGSDSLMSLRALARAHSPQKGSGP